MALNHVSRKDLIDAAATAAAVTKQTAAAILDAALDRVALAIRVGEAVRLGDLGTLKPTERKARNGRNPKTGEAITIAARRGVKFAPAKGLFG